MDIKSNCAITLLSEIYFAVLNSEMIYILDVYNSTRSTAHRIDEQNQNID